MAINGPHTSHLRSLSGVKRTCLCAVRMSAFDAVDGARSAASKCYRVGVLKRARLKEVRPGNETAFEVLKELARTRRRNAETVVPGIGRTRLGQCTAKCGLSIGTRSAQSIRASGSIVPHQQAGHVTAPDQSCTNLTMFLPGRRPHVTHSGRPATHS